VLCWLSWANLSVLLLIWAIEAFVGERRWTTTLLTYAPQAPFLAPAAVLLIVSVAVRDWAKAMVNLAAGVFCILALMGFHFSLHFARPAGSPLRLLTFNIHSGARGVKAIDRVIDEIQPDVICLQEAQLWPRRGGPPDPLADLLDGYSVVTHGELAIASKYPILSSEVRLLCESGIRRPALGAVIDFNGHEVEVVTVHLMTSAHRETVLHHTGTLGSYVEGTGRVRSEQVAGLIAWTRTIRRPLIIAGDFNTPPRGRFYRRLHREYKDAFAEAGLGLGHTFRSNIPVLRIDYVFLDNGVAPVRSYVPKVRASDHRPLVAELAVP
jgi:vancomycin resistance protein VanJ